MGAAFSIEDARSIQEGQTAAEVIGLLGEPWDKSRRDEAEVWQYYARERRDGVTYYLGVLPKRKPLFIREYRLSVVLQNGVVEEAVYTETEVE
jgi:outer membrane protein assembly factor BamE (lipoprotein component of BamABCDE complex)